MALPPRVYYTLQEVTARWGCNIADVAGWAAAGKFHIMTALLQNSRREGFTSRIHAVRRAA